jgi:hypothetical protein
MKGKLRVTEEHSTQSENQPSRLTLYGLAMVGGLGITMMIIAATIGVIGGAELDAASTNLIGLSVVAGLLLLIIAIGFWIGLVRPHADFDDINVPLEPEPHH